MYIPDLIQLSAEIAREDAESKAYVSDLALRNVDKFLWLIEPHIPPELQLVFTGIQDDVKFARQAVTHGA